ncbi:MAG TPA: CPBP family intramembrane glutamic endopeptidase [Candidatus Acidoferrum sp.]|nr:CPBP family intramembrane glutamic endopeptidase [Candidatus Acidoferrum sp.]
MSGPEPGQDPGPGQIPEAEQIQVAEQITVPGHGLASAPEPRPGLRTFTLEGRAAPGLFLVGWLAVIMGAAVLIVAAQAGVDRSISIALALVGFGLLSIGLIAGAGSQAMERKARAAAAGSVRATTTSGDSGPDAAIGYTGPSPFLVFAAAFVLSVLVISLIGGPLVALGLDPQGPAGILLAVVIQGLIYLALIRLLVVGAGGLSWRDMGIADRSTKALAGDIGGGVLLAVPVLFVTALITVVLVQFLPTPASPLPSTGAATGIALNVLAAVVVAPLGEELCFRGFATTAWARSMSPRRAIVRGAIFFAAIHVLQVGGVDFVDAAGRATVAFVGRLPIALALGQTFMARRSIAAPIALHATFNGLILLAQLSTG